MSQQKMTEMFQRIKTASNRIFNVASND